MVPRVCRGVRHDPRARKGGGELAVLRTSGELDDNGAALYTCDACPSAFCSVCLMRLFSVGAIAEANTAAPWACPDCTKRELA